MSSYGGFPPISLCNKDIKKNKNKNKNITDDDDDAKKKLRHFDTKNVNDIVSIKNLLENKLNDQTPFIKL